MEKYSDLVIPEAFSSLLRQLIVNISSYQAHHKTVIEYGYA
jgi:hypothetical protein